MALHPERCKSYTTKAPSDGKALKLKRITKNIRGREEMDKVFSPCVSCQTLTETKCSACKASYYCSRLCQKKDWKRHRPDCLQKRLDDQDQEEKIVEIVDTESLELAVELREDSTVHGRGVFSTRKIKQGEKLCFFDGNLMDARVRIRMSKDPQTGVLSIINADEVFAKIGASTIDVNMCLAHPDPKKQAVKVGFHQPKTPFGIGQFINDAVAPSINELDFGQALASLHHYRSQSLSKANCELCGPNFWFQATKDIDEGQEVVTHYGHEFWLQKYLVEATQIQWRMLFYALQTQDNKAFDLRKFFDYDDATCSSFLKTVLLVDEEEVERSRPKDMLMTLTEKLKNLASKLCSAESKEEEEGHYHEKSNSRPDLDPTKPALKATESNRDIYLRANPITFQVNGQSITLDTDKVSTNTSLARFLRTHLNLTGTKISCGQAGCGACVVVATFMDPATNQPKTRSVNSCITPVLKCEGWSITTVEGVGNEQDGMSPVQTALAGFHGTQCGFCSPGMVMVMHGLLEQNPNPTMEEIEQLLDGNLCRCTGYRPIFDAFKSLAQNATPELKQKLADIEDLVTRDGGQKFTCPKTQKPCSGLCASKAKGSKTDDDTMQYVKSVDGEWMKPATVNDLMALLANVPPGTKYRIVAGNTGTGIFNNDGPYEQFFDISLIPDLTSILTIPFIIGAGVSLNDFIKALEDQVATFEPNYAYCQQMANHIRKVANTNVRNVGTIGGNLMLKHEHNDFPSDIFLLLEAVGATLHVRDILGRTTTFSPSAWLAESMDQKLLLFITLPELTPNHVFMSYKLTPRSQNAHAYVNAAFLATVSNDGGLAIITSRPNFVFGGIHADFIHATNTENSIVSAILNDNMTLQNVMADLESEITSVIEDEPVLASKEYRTHLAKALMYKFLIIACGDLAGPRLEASGTQISRGVSKGSQSFPTNPPDYPITEPIEKLEGKIQCTGEAEYVDDIPVASGELFAAFVLSKKANCDLASVDPAPALAMPGVVAYYDQEAIPGLNSVDSFEGSTDELFCSGYVRYSGQPIGVIVADTYEHARAAAKAVDITYTNEQPPILTIKDALDSKTDHQSKANKAVTVGAPSRTKKSNGSKQLREISGEFQVGSQYHFHMETQSTIVRPIEKGHYDVQCATQWMDGLSLVVSKVLDIGMNKINVSVKRLGGAYGGKILKPCFVTAACAVAAFKLRKPVRMVLDLECNMESMGKRNPYLYQYTASMDDQDIISSISYDFYDDSGCSLLGGEHGYAQDFVQSCYSGQWTLTGNTVTTNTPSNTACRAPISTQNHAMIEIVMEHLAKEYGLDPLEFRMKNFLSDGDSLVTGGQFQGPNPLPTMIEQLKTSSDYDARVTAVETFNAQNAWTKRGICLIPMRWEFKLAGVMQIVQVTISALDGTVSVTIGGIEMGQGITTKVAQVVAKALRIDMNLISIKPSNNFVGLNSSITGGSTGSDMSCAAAKIACEELRQRLDDVEATMDNPTWLQLLAQCYYVHGMDLTARHMSESNKDAIRDYDIWAAVVTEVEVDTLTGEKTIRRVDLLEDTGSTISPQVDVGQVEGGLVFGLGLWTSEEIKHDPATGRLLTRDTWEYKPPASQDIPEEMNITLYNSGNNPNGVLGSKATGEPSTLLGVSALIAIRRALDQVKSETSQDQTWYNLDGPATHERIQGSSGVTSSNFFLV